MVGDGEELVPRLRRSVFLMPENTLGGLDSCFHCFSPTSLGWESEGLGSNPSPAIDLLDAPGQVPSLWSLGFLPCGTGDNTPQPVSIRRARGDDCRHRAGAQWGKDEYGT